MTFSQPSWPPWPPPSQHDRDEIRDRIKDSEHSILDIKGTQENHGRRLTRLEAAAAIILWALLNGKALEAAPGTADLAANILRGLIK